jgi:hypothetical protein
MCTSHPDFVRPFALATVSVGLVSWVSTQSPSFDAWIVNISIPQPAWANKIAADNRALQPAGKLVVGDEKIDPSDPAL